MSYDGIPCAPLLARDPSHSAPDTGYPIIIVVVEDSLCCDWCRTLVLSYPWSLMSMEKPCGPTRFYALLPVLQHFRLVLSYRWEYSEAFEFDVSFAVSRLFVVMIFLKFVFVQVSFKDIPGFLLTEFCDRACVPRCSSPPLHMVSDLIGTLVRNDLVEERRSLGNTDGGLPVPVRPWLALCQSDTLGGVEEDERFGRPWRGIDTEERRSLYLADDDRTRH